MNRILVSGVNERYFNLFLLMVKSFPKIYDKFIVYHPCKLVDKVKSWKETYPELAFIDFRKMSLHPEFRKEIDPVKSKITSGNFVPVESWMKLQVVEDFSVGVLWCDADCIANKYFEWPEEDYNCDIILEKDGSQKFLYDRLPEEIRNKKLVPILYNTGFMWLNGSELRRKNIVKKAREFVQKYELWDHEQGFINCMSISGELKCKPFSQKYQTFRDNTKELIKDETALNALYRNNKTFNRRMKWQI